jgi:hypothetical protein
MSGQHAHPKGAALTVPDVLARLVVEYRDALEAERRPYGRHAIRTAAMTANESSVSGVTVVAAAYRRLLAGVDDGDDTERQRHRTGRFGGHGASD